MIISGKFSRAEIRDIGANVAASHTNANNVDIPASDKESILNYLVTIYSRFTVK
jgi:hypothetical protein